MKWIRVTYVENIPLRQGRSVRIGSHVIAIFNLGNVFRAVENSCPHRNGPLADGIVSGDDVICPLHAWRFSLETGDACLPQREGVCVRTFETKIVDGVVMISVPAEETEPCGVER